jgi:sterol desaturase/sphingolipid hydroxylase (fatty acid hydroxylase superfamily)
MALNPIVVSIPLFSGLIALEAWLNRRGGGNAYESKDTWTNIALGFGSVFWGAVLGLGIGLLYGFLYELAPYKIPADAWWAWVLLFVLDDFAYYWFHRISHESRFFWNFHVVHHSSEHFNLSVAVRQSWFSGLAHWIFYAPLMLLGFAPWMQLTAHGFNLLWQFWIHTPYVKSMGPLEYIFNVPSHHRVHHGVNDIYIDRNYAGVFIIWDRLFGTFTDQTETPRYGIIKPINSNNLLWINTHAWVEMYEAIKSRKTLLGKLRCIFASPNMEYIEAHENQITA